MLRRREAKRRGPRIASKTSPCPFGGFHTLDAPNATRHLQRHHFGKRAAVVEKHVAAVHLNGNLRRDGAPEFFLNCVSDALCQLRVGGYGLRRARSGSDGCEGRKRNSGDQEKDDGLFSHGARILAPMRFSVSEYVRWEDIDAAGIINYQAYLRFFGLAEVELFRSCCRSYPTLFDDLRLWPPRVDVEGDFFHPVTLDQLLI